MIAEGNIRFLDPGNDQVFAYERSGEGRILTVICSFSGNHETISRELAEKVHSGTILISNYKGNLCMQEQNTGSMLRPYEAVAVWSR